MGDFGPLPDPGSDEGGSHWSVSNLISEPGMKKLAKRAMRCEKKKKEARRVKIRVGTVVNNTGGGATRLKLNQRAGHGEVGEEGNAL